LQGVDGVARVMPFIEEEMIVQSARRTLGAVVRGIPVVDLQKLKPDVEEGLIPDPKAKTPQTLIGRELAHRLDLLLGSQVRLISPIERGGAMGLVPRSQVFNVSGFYASGHYEFDQQYLFVSIEDAQDLVKWGNAISGWQVWATSLDSADQVQHKIDQIIPTDLKAQSWTVFNSALFESLKLEQYSMFVILTFAVIIAVMNIVITLMMHVTQKRKNIGILRALGASKEQIRRIFVWQGALLGSVGLGMGAIMTFLFIIYLKYFSSYLLPEIYYDRTIPVEVRPLSLLLIYVVAITCIYLATLYPASRAARLDPLEAIRE
jgi:lipoprotein-releasing system permease protein